MTVMSRKEGTNAPPGSDTNLYITISYIYIYIIYIYIIIYYG